MKKINLLSLCAILAVLCIPVIGSAFSFTEHQQEEARQEESRKETIAELTSIPCKKDLKDKKIALVIGEQHTDGSYGVRQSRYGNLFQVINQKLRAVGLQTYTHEEITRQVAKAEMEAFLANDLDSAVSASGRLAADFILRGLISTRIRKNPVVGIQEVFVTNNSLETREDILNKLKVLIAAFKSANEGNRSVNLDDIGDYCLPTVRIEKWNNIPG